MQVIRRCTEAEFEPSETRKRRLYIVARAHARRAYELRNSHPSLDPNAYLFKALAYLPEQYRLKY